MISIGSLIRRHHAHYLRSEGAAEDYCDELVDGSGFPYVDEVSSVSALNEPPEPIFVDAVLEEQHRRFLNEVEGR